MTTMDGIPSLREYAGMKLVSVARQRKRQRESALPSASTNAIVRLMLHLAGFVLLTIMGFEINTIAGYAAAGISCFLLSTLLTGGGEEQPKRAPDLRTGR